MNDAEPKGEVITRAGAEIVISYCIACYRPRFAAKLVEDLVRKTSVPFEILLWFNLADAEFEDFLERMVAGGAAVQVIGKTPERLDGGERAALDAAIGTIRRTGDLHRNALPLFVIDRQAHDNA
jgi:hypothetical protein